MRRERKTTASLIESQAISNDKPDANESALTLLNRWRTNHEESALEKAIPLIEHELRRNARAHIRKWKKGFSVLDSAVLVQETFQRLIDQEGRRADKNIVSEPWQNKAHFYFIAGRLMRQILVDYARKRQRQVPRASLEEVEMQSHGRAKELIALDDALLSLSKIDERKTRIVECRYFLQMSIHETAEALGVSEHVIEFEWTLTKKWLAKEMGVNKAG